MDCCGKRSADVAHLLRIDLGGVSDIWNRDQRHSLKDMIDENENHGYYQRTLFV